MQLNNPYLATNDRSLEVGVLRAFRDQADAASKLSHLPFLIPSNEPESAIL
ncbi:hypothetical protein KR50_14780 [Jeotgalibacillus campisalis]|uniref:Uncharacterized protein n=1 Tax=Jeotgalibacillus campisalis TaxID=220754 RepID=A0A0C2VHU2_9BACL|nr:hypothetical protein KR50_14780 [Jeotgalibacillus campisalis]